MKLLTLFFLFFTIPAWGAVVVDNTSTASTVDTPSDTLSWSHTTSGSDRVLIVGLAGTGYGHETFTSCTATYNSVSMTSATAFANSNNDGIGLQIFSLVNPASGSNTVAIDCSGIAPMNMTAVAVSFTGANQSTPTGTVATLNSGSDDVPTVDVSSATGDVVFAIVSGVGAVIGVQGGWLSATPGTGETEQLDFLTSYNGNSNVFGYAATKLGSATVTVQPTLDWTISGEYRSMAGVSIVAAPSGALVRKKAIIIQ